MKEARRSPMYKTYSERHHDSPASSLHEAMPPTEEPNPADPAPPRRASFAVERTASPAPFRPLLPPAFVLSRSLGPRASGRTTPGHFFDRFKKLKIAPGGPPEPSTRRHPMRMSTGSRRLATYGHGDYDMGIAQ